jgi:MFS family permease
MPAQTAQRPPSLLQREHLPFAVGAVALVTLGAFENRATMTVLPTVAQDLDGLWLFGAAAAAPLIAYVVSTALGGVWADRRGPVPALRLGMLVFVLSQLALGLTPSMQVFTVARVASGFAEGLLDIGLTVLLARALPEELRAKVFAAFAAAWVLPSLLGPSIAGSLTEWVHWRAVFLLGAVLLVPAALALRPSMRSAARSSGPATPWSVSERRTLQMAVAVAVALSVLTAGGAMLGGGGLVPTVGLSIVLLASVATIPLLRALLPTGTLTLAPGIPAVVALRGLVAAAFAMVGTFMPLMLSTIHHYGPAAAGLSLTITGVAWAGGSQLHGLRAVQARTSATARLRLGFTLIALGATGPALTALEVLPVWAGLALWAVAGLGMGVTSPTLSTQMLALSPVASQGRNTAASSLTGSVTQAVALALVGAAIAWLEPTLPGWLFATVMVAGAMVAALGAVTAHRAARAVAG